MCGTCGCGDGGAAGRGPGGERGRGDAHVHEHVHGHVHEHVHGREDGREGRRIRLEARLLAKNDEVAWANRTWLAAHDVVTLNLMGAPGAGKTALLERTVPALGGEVPVSVLEGDQDTERDAERIRATGANVAQINTGPGCHLDAEMVARGIEGLAPPPGSLMFVENVGNLVCPALFDLGEHLKVVVLSVTEGDDKPLKYPHMFRVADALVLHKIDLLPHVPFDLERGLENARRVRPGLRTFGLSSQTGEGLDAWLAWLRRIRPAAKASARLGGAAP